MRDNVSLSSLYTPSELAARAGERAKGLRLSSGMRQEDAARAAGISRATLQRFEATGQAAFDAVVRLLVAYRAEGGLDSLFAQRSETRSLDDVIDAQKTRQRARRVRRP